MVNFDSILSGLHTDSTLADDQLKTPIVINGQRTFEVPEDYNLVLGYAGDVNSQVVTFQFPRRHERHDLSACKYQTIKWQNLTSGTEGISVLQKGTVSEETWLASWAVPPEAMIVAGKIEIAFSLYDEHNGKIAFSWNTPSFKEFSIGGTANQIADYKISDNSLPAKNEILNVNIENRNIEAPVNWNPTIASFGDIGLSKVFFEINQYVRGIDLLNDKFEIYVGVSFISDTVDDYRISNENIRSMFVSETNHKANKVLITWDVPDTITNNAQGYSGTFSISLKLVVEDDEHNITKRWSTAKFNKVAIGPSALQDDLVVLVARDEGLVQKVVDKVVDEVINDKIDDYMDSNYFVIDGN